MARIEDLTDHDRYRIEKAREYLVASEQLNLSDDRAMARMLGRLEVAVRQLLEMLDEGGAA